MYELSKNRFLELKHHCMQVPEWEKQLELEEEIFERHKGDDPTGEQAAWIAELKRRLKVVYETLDEAFEPMCHKSGYYSIVYGLRFPPDFPQYEMRRKFYWLLDKKL